MMVRSASLHPVGVSGDPFIIRGPALISFSGGRTSAYMLRRILDAHGGTLPDDVVVAFANTGKEREETLRFVHECGSRWGVHVHWLEWRDAKPCFEPVGFNSASRSGEPLAALIAKKGYLPNAVTRFCTQEAKVRVMRDFARSIGWEHWINVIGFRFDEGHRVLKMERANEIGKERWRSIAPLAEAKIGRRDVEAFWRAQPFDLQLKSYEGNCDLCFLKSEAKLKALIRENPGMDAWWQTQERVVTTMRATKAGARFVTEYSYADLARQVAAQPHMFDDLADDGNDPDCTGDVCGGDSPADIVALQRHFEKTRAA